MLLCATHEVAIYIPPVPSSPIPPASAVSICRRFLEGVAAGPAPDARVHDDRDASITIVEQVFFPKVEGKTPAFEALVADVSRGKIRVLLVADPSALDRIPDPDGHVRRLDDQVEIVHAATRLAEVPPEEELEKLHQGDPDTWRFRLYPLIDRRPTRRHSREPPLVGAPRALVEAMLRRDALSNWCRIACEAAPRALDDQRRTMQDQAARHFEQWLRDGAERFGLSAADPETTYWECIERAHGHLARGDWDGATKEVRAAQSLAGEASAATVEERVLAAADFGRGDFAKGWRDFTGCALRDMLLGAPWQPTAPVAIAVGLPEAESALRHVTFLLTRVSSITEPELLEAIDRLAAALPEDRARALREATKPYEEVPSGRAKKSKTRSKRKRDPHRD